MRGSRWFVLALVCFSNVLWADKLEEALEWSRQELQVTKQELSQARDVIVDEKLPLARESRELREQLLQLKGEKRLLDEQREGGDYEVKQLKSERAAISDVASYLSDQAVRFRQNFESSLVAGERYAHAGSLLEMDKVHRDGSYTLLERAEVQWRIMEASLNRLDQLVGGAKFSTEAVSGEGVLEGGTAIEFGPLVFFKSDNGVELGNLTIGDSLQPQLRRLNDEHAVRVEALFAGNLAQIPVDPTLGQASLIQEEAVGLREHVRQGGFWMIPILLFGACAFATGIFKWLALQKLRVPEVGEYAKLKALSPDEVSSSYRGEVRTLVSRLVAVENASTEVQSAELDVAYQEFKFKLNRWLPFIALTAGVSPLLGLLGTVTGMIKTFQLISIFGAGDAKLLSSGISEALITTEFGLVVAIPALVLHAYLQRRVKKILVGAANLMEHASREVVA